jgi:acyl-coenzyme A thioesterase PaaI-like protein
MRKLKNPFAEKGEYHCFGCSPHNLEGLRMEFYEDGEEILSIWKPQARFEGFKDVLHGGVQATLMDELASWVVFLKAQTGGMTYRLHTKYRSPVRISRGDLTLRGRLVELKKRLAFIEVKLHDGEGTCCSECMAEYFLQPRELAQNAYHYPGRDAFYEK